MVTTWLDLLGALLLISAAGLFAHQLWGLPAALAVAGASLLFLSWIIDRPRKVKSGGEQK